MTDDAGDTGCTVAAGRVDADQGATETKADHSVAEVPAENQDSSTRIKQGRRGRARILCNNKAVSLILVLLLLMTAGASTWIYFKRYRPHQQTDPNVAQTVISAASDGTVALLSYSPDSLEKDFATAKSHLVGDFLSYYNDFTEKIVAPAAKEKSLKTTAHVMRAAVSELHPNSALVLVFVDQSTTSKDRPNASMAASSVLVSMIRINHDWLITKFDPV